MKNTCIILLISPGFMLNVCLVCLLWAFWLGFLCVDLVKRLEESSVGKPKHRNQRKRMNVLSAEASDSRAKTVESFSDFGSVRALWCDLDLKLKIKRDIIADIWENIIYYIFTELPF